MDGLSVYCGTAWLPLPDGWWSACCAAHDAAGITLQSNWDFATCLMDAGGLVLAAIGFAFVMAGWIIKRLGLWPVDNRNKQPASAGFFMEGSMMDRAAFYDELRSSPVVFGKRLTPGQVEGMEMLLDVWAEFYADDPLEWLAYNLGTAYHETAATMQPIVERGGRSYFNRYDIQHNPRKARELGNIYPGDGFRYRGEGHVQNTGRRNARKATQELNAAFDLGIDLEKNPGERGDPFVSAHSLFMGNREGWWTGRGLGRYIDPPHKIDFVNARRVVNGTDKAAKIARYAETFLDALKAAGGAPTLDAPTIPNAPIYPQDPDPLPSPPDIPAPDETPSQPPSGGFFMALLRWLLGGKFR